MGLLLGRLRLLATAARVDGGVDVGGGDVGKLEKTKLVTPREMATTRAAGAG